MTTRQKYEILYRFFRLQGSGLRDWFMYYEHGFTLSRVWNDKTNEGLDAFNHNMTYVTLHWHETNSNYNIYPVEIVKAACTSAIWGLISMGTQPRKSIDEFDRSMWAKMSDGLRHRLIGKLERRVPVKYHRQAMDEQRGLRYDWSHPRKPRTYD